MAKSSSRSSNGSAKNKPAQPKAGDKKHNQQPPVIPPAGENGGDGEDQGTPPVIPPAGENGGDGEDQQKPPVIPPAGKNGGKKKTTFDDLMEPYLKAYPNEKVFHISTDGQVFLNANLAEAKAHQRSLNKESAKEDKLETYESK